jgi:hypothetical protein
LVRYKAGDGNGDPSCTRNYVTKDTPPLKLGSWLHCQRSVRKGTRKRKLSVEQIRRLEELCVWWNRNNKGGTSSLVYSWSSLQYTRKIYCNGNFIFFADLFIYHEPYTNETRMTGMWMDTQSRPRIDFKTFPTIFRFAKIII